MVRGALAVSFIIGFVIGQSGAAAAAPRDPVANLMAAAEHNYTPEIEEAEDYFSPERLKTIYSRAFVKSYEDATARAMDNDEGVFEADMITDSQDACPLKDIKIDVKPAEADFTPVHVTFRPYACMKGDPTQSEIKTVIFMTVKEDGRDVIEDIFQTDADKRAWSIKEQMDRYGR
jgi:hypothetical protein